MWAAYWSARVLAMKRAGVHVTTRAIRYQKEAIPQTDGTMKTVTQSHEKGIDVRLALDVLQCARTRQYDVVVIYSQDQDLSEIATEVRAIADEQARTIKVVCAFPDGPYASLKRGIDKTDWIRIDQALYDTCLDPHDYRPKQSVVAAPTL